MSVNPNRRASDEIMLEMHSNIAVLCDNMRKLVGDGNGEHGRIPRIERRVDSLEDTRASVKGWVRGVAWVIGGLSALVGFIYSIAKAIASL